MKFDWDLKKAKVNLVKHRVSFDEGATAFLDPMAVSGPDPDHPIDENRYITFGFSKLGRLLAVCHTHRPGTIRIINMRRAAKGNCMKKVKKDEMRPEYKRSDFTSLKRGKFYAEVAGGTSVALLDPLIANAFPTSKAVNEALHGLLVLTEQTSRITTPSTGRRGKRGGAARQPL